MHEYQHGKYRVHLFWDLETDVHRTSKVVTGLVELARLNAIVLHPHIGITSEQTGRPDGHVFIWMVAERTLDRKGLNIAIDLHDLSTFFYEQALQACDVYLKKSFYPPDVTRFAVAYAGKVIPFGFNMPCSSSYSKRVVRGWLLKLYSRMFLHSPRKAFTRWRGEWGGYRTFLDGPVMSDFEQAPNVPLEHRVVFQTRLWTQRDVGPDDHEAVNSLRVNIVRTLRSQLGKQFVGGVVPTSFARQFYPDVISTFPARRQNFIRWSKKFLIGIYVRGLNYSYGFRFAEHLAASQCIVAHPDGFRNPAPSPPQEGVHYLPFTTPDECVEQCRKILNNQELVQAMRQANYDYYHREVEPARHLWNCLERAFQHVEVVR